MRATSSFYTPGQIAVLEALHAKYRTAREHLVAHVVAFTPDGLVHNQTCHLGLGRNGGSGVCPCPCGAEYLLPPTQPTRVVQAPPRDVVLFP